MKEEVLAKTDFDPATLWQWGTMQAMALIEVLKSCEKTYGEEGQRIVRDALGRIGYDVGRQILDGAELPEDLEENELMSFFATVVNRIAYASLEAPRIDDEGKGKATFDILWCPHQDHYGAFDCRVQRYFVQGMLDAFAEATGKRGWTVRFDTTIPAGAPTCHFTMWRPTDAERAQWEKDTARMELKALRLSKGAP